MDTQIEFARDFAFQKHNQPAPEQRYGNQPYSKHLQDVYNNGERYINYIAEDKRETVLKACYCHDLIEDSELDANDLEVIFGHELADIVFRVSNERGWSRKEKNFKTYPKIWSNDLAIFVKLCDRIANTKNSKETGYKMYERYREEYPVFRYALKIKELYSDMWDELDELNNYYGICR